MDDLQNQLNGAVDEVAPRILGATLTRELDGQIIRTKIVEVEAYDQHDLASHSYRGKTERTQVMFEQSGHLYVYFTYGMHYCCNVVTGPEGHGAAVLIRAVEPLEGKQSMTQHRQVAGVNLSNGPAKLCQALKIDKQLNGHNLQMNPLRLTLSKPLPDADIIRTTRIGISEAKNVPWRFYIKGNEYVSKM